MYLHMLDSNRDFALANKSDDVLLTSKGIPAAWWSNAAPRKGLNYLQEERVWLTLTQLYLTPASVQQYIAQIGTGGPQGLGNGAAAGEGAGDELPSSFAKDLREAVEKANVVMWEMPLLQKVPGAVSGGLGNGSASDGAAGGQVSGYLIDVRTEDVVKLLTKKKVSVNGVKLEFKRGSDRTPAPQVTNP